MSGTNGKVTRVKAPPITGGDVDMSPRKKVANLTRPETTAGCRAKKDSNGAPTVEELMTEKKFLISLLQQVRFYLWLLVKYGMHYIAITVFK
jgi:hypothetical protein